jgi:DHA2 family multidrug resistance protein
MEQLDTTIANVVLAYIAGGIGVSQDEPSWVVTTYLVANAVALTASSFLARLLGRRSFFLTCLALFTASSVLCGYAPNLNNLLLFRLAQGLAGGGMVPLAQSIFGDSFPPEKRGQGFALFGVAVVVAPVVGPTLGGWLADNFSWHWCFMINGPIDVVALTLIAAILPAPKDAAEQRKRLQEQGGFDLVGFVLVATFLGALEIMLDRGLEDDWFASSFIVEIAAICALAFVLMIPWEFSRRNPMIDLRMVATRQFGACFVVMLASGAISARDRPVRTQSRATGFRLYGDLGRHRDVPWRLRHDDYDVHCRPADGQGPTQISDRHREMVTALSMYDMTNVYGYLDFWFFARSSIRRSHLPTAARCSPFPRPTATPRGPAARLQSAASRRKLIWCFGELPRYLRFLTKGSAFSANASSDAR